MSGVLGAGPPRVAYSPGSYAVNLALRYKIPSVGSRCSVDILVGIWPACVRNVVTFLSSKCWCLPSGLVIG